MTCERMNDRFRKKKKNAFTFRDCEGSKICQLLEMQEKKSNRLVGKENEGYCDS